MFNSVNRKECIHAENESQDAVTNEHTTGPQNTSLHPSFPIPDIRGETRGKDTTHSICSVPGVPSHEEGSSLASSSIALMVESSQRQHAPFHRVYMEKQRIVSNSKKGRHVETRVSMVETTTSFKEHGSQNQDQVGDDGLDLFLESPGTSSVEPRASHIFLEPRLRPNSSDLFL